jgi:hypothetical protein
MQTRSQQAITRWADPIYREKQTQRIREVKRGCAWDMPTEEFAALVKRSTTISAIAQACGVLSRNHKAVLGRIRIEGHDISHIPLGRLCNLGRKFTSRMVSLTEALVEHSTYNQKSLKRRLIEECVLKNECVVCEQGPIWNGQPLTLILDHINGINDDAQQNNLRLVCPNCETQLPTHTGRNRNKYPNGNPRCKRRKDPQAWLKKAQST